MLKKVKISKKSLEGKDGLKMQQKERLLSDSLTISFI